MITKFYSEEIPHPAIQDWEEKAGEYLEKNDMGKSAYDAFYLTKSITCSEDPEEAGVVVVRALMGDLEGKMSKEKKYVCFQTFYNQGDLSLIDVVRLPEEMHRDIIRTYVRDVLKEGDPGEIGDYAFSRFLIAGGHIRPTEKEIFFEGGSGDFGEQIAGYSVNGITAHLLNQSDKLLTTRSKKSQEGEKYLEKCCDLMIGHKNTPEFYSKMVDMFVADPIKEEVYVGSQQRGAILQMKAYDRAINEGIPFEQALVEEMSGGIGREMLLKGVVASLRERS